LLIRYLFGLRGDALSTGPSAERAAPLLIEAHIESLMP
jgi:hypothetical protein